MKCNCFYLSAIGDVSLVDSGKAGLHLLKALAKSTKVRNNMSLNLVVLREYF